MEKVQFQQEQADLWMVCEEDEEDFGSAEDEEDFGSAEDEEDFGPAEDEEDFGPAEDISSSQGSLVKCSAAPPSFKINGSLIQQVPPTGMQLRLCFHPGGSSSGFTQILLPDTGVSSSPPPTTPPHVTPPTPVITGVLSGEEAHRVLTNQSEAEFPTQPLPTRTRPTAAHRPLLKGQMKSAATSSSPPSFCSTCSSSYKLVPELRGLLCLCSPAIAQSLKNLHTTRRRSKGKSKDPRPGLGQTPCLRPSPESGLVAGTEHGAVTSAALRLPLVEKQQTGLCFPASTAASCMSPEGVNMDEQEEAQEECLSLEPPQSKLVIMVEDFYYGSTPGQEPANQTARAKRKRQHGPYSCIYCPETLVDNIQLMSHTIGHVTSQDSQNASVPTCRHCFRPFLSTLRLQRHLEAVHSPKSEVTAQCRICELAFDSEPTFLRHMKATHKPGEMPYACQVCDFRSSFHSQISFHFDQCHSGTGLLLCLYCLRVLSSSSCYQQHVARHQRKQAFSCSKCRLHFLFVRERLAHQRLHHGTHVKPPQLSRLKPGTKVTVRTYSAGGKDDHRKGLKRPEPCKVVDVDPPTHTKKVKSSRQMQRLGPLLVNLDHKGAPLQCVECFSSVEDFASHFPSLVYCSVCRYLTCCSTSYANHMINDHSTFRAKSHFFTVFQSEPKLSQRPLLCVVCSLTTSRGDLMANHLAEQPEHRCLLLGGSECDPSLTTALEEDSQMNPGGGAFVPIHQLLDQGGSAQLSVKPLLRPCSQNRLYPAMLVKVLGPRPHPEQTPHAQASAPPPKLGKSCPPFEKARAPPLTTSQFWSLVLALTLGPHQACRQCGVTLGTLHSFLVQLRQGPRHWVVKGKGFPRGAWPWKTSQLARWLLLQREQQQLGGPEVLLPVARALLEARSPLKHHLAWTAHFLLRHDLALDPIETLEPLATKDPSETPDLNLRQPASSGRLPKILLGKSRAFIHLLNTEVQNRHPHQLACMVEISLWLDLIQYSRKDPVALQLIGSPGEAPMFSLVLSGLADGTFLPPLLFFGRSLPPLPSGFPDNVLLEARPEGLQDLDMQRTWIHKVWGPHLVSQQNSMLLLLDSHRGHLTEEFKSSFSGTSSGSSTRVLYIPSACSSRLQPLNLCIVPALRGFIQTRWHQMVSKGGLEGLSLGQLCLTLACWFSELYSTLHSGTHFLQRSFSSVCKGEVLESRTEAAYLTQELLKALHAPPTGETRPLPH